MTVDEPFVFPDLKSGAEMRQHVEAMRSGYRVFIAVMLDVTGRVDVIAVVEEVDAVKSHQHD